MARRKRSRKSQTKPESDLLRPVGKTPGTVWLCLALLVLAGTAAYWNSFDGVFVYDDTKHVVRDAKRRAEQPFFHMLTARRPLVELSLAMNYQLAEKGPPTEEAPGGTMNPWGYHLFNLIVHLLAAMALFGVIRRTVQLADFNESLVESAHWFAAAATLLWLVHPLQTQSVTYVIQRGESMMGLFYLLTLYCLIRGASSARTRTWWYLAAVVACGLGTASKAVIVTAPLIIMLYDRIFLARSIESLLRKRAILYVGLVLVTVFFLRLTGVARGVLDPKIKGTPTVGFGYDGISPSDYLLTQAQVIPQYLKLSLWPRNQALDYQWPPVQDISNWPAQKFIVELALPGLLVLALLAATLLGLLKRPWLGFVGAWFFLILAPTSSFIPIKDPIYEHRMYLSLAAVVVLILAAIWWVAGRVSEHWVEVGSSKIHRNAALFCLVPALALTYLTHERNKVYFDPMVVWYDAVRNHPNNARAHNNLGKHLLDKHGKLVKKEKELAKTTLEEAIKHLKEAVRLDPKFLRAHYNLGNGLRANKELDAAIASYHEALKLDPRYIEARIMLGNAHTDRSVVLGGTSDPRGRAEMEKAEKTFRDALAKRRRREQPHLIARAHFNLGNTLTRLARIKDARDEYTKALEHNPTHFKSQYGIGLMSNRLGERRKAIEAYQKALKLNPNYFKAWYDLGEAYRATGQKDKAIDAYQSLVARRPRDTNALFKLGSLCAEVGRIGEAKASFERILKIRPDHVQAKRSLQQLNARQN
ncbi:MAG: tetratricopeptide repeat protein [Phycisphaerales bacterium]|nr:tetratricopeptide repeat protein [Phycisphaerales bacterium]